MLVALVMGFACGLPLLLTMSVLQAWMKDAGVDLSVIGMMALVGLPYTLKFLWAPFLDRFTLPFLGRRRGWMLVAQVALTVSIAGLGQSVRKKDGRLIVHVIRSTDEYSPQFRRPRCRESGVLSGVEQ